MKLEDSLRTGYGGWRGWWFVAWLLLFGPATIAFASIPASDFALGFARLGCDSDSNVATSQNEVATVSLRYDNRDRLTNVTTQAGTVSWSVGYRYDKNGNTTNIVYPGGLVVAYTFDDQDRCTKVKDWLNHETTFGYDDAGRMTSISYPNGVTASYGHDGMGRRTSYQYAKGGNTFISRTLIRNALGYKLQENVNAGLNPVPTNARRRASAFDVADRLATSTDTPGGPVSYHYDAKGNLTNSVSATVNTVYVWDDDNRLTAVTNNGVATTYVYDGLGNRISQSSGGTTFYWALNQVAGLKNALVSMNGAGTVIGCYIWGPSGLISHIDPINGNTIQYFHADEQGSTLAMTDANGDVTDQFTYAPYGELTGRSGNSSTPYQWLGGLAVRTEANGLYFMLNRYYSPELKRFLSEDPSGIDSFPNLYAYGNMNPAFFTDPYGLEAGGVGWGDAFKYAAQSWANAAQQAASAVAAPFAYVQEHILDPIGLTVDQQMNLAMSTPVGADDAAVAALGAVTTLGMRAAKAEATVLGHYPAYTEMAEQLGARRFNVPTEFWNKMTPAEQWTANQKFLDRMISRGDDVILATPFKKAEPGSFFERELQYLQSKGFKPSADGTRMVPGGGN